MQPLIELQYAFATPEQIAEVDTAAAAAASSATAASGSASAAASSATAAASSATAASGSATAAATSATAAATSATAASTSAIAAAASNTPAHAWADSAATLASISGQMILTTSATPPSGFSYTTFRMVLEKNWFSRTDDPTGRYDAAGTVYDNKLWVCGGYNGSYLTTLDYYDPTTNTWTSKAGLGTATHYHSLAEAGGFLYAMGGYQSGTTITAANYKYNPSTNSWASKHVMPAVRESHAAVSYGGKIYVIGGVLTDGTFQPLITSTIPRLIPGPQPRHCR